MTLAQIEHADTFRDPLPTKSTLDRMDDVITKRRHLLVTIRNKERELSRLTDKDDQMSDRFVSLSNQMHQAQLRLADNLREIVEVAGQIHDEYAAVEIIGGTI
jgi:hypothetical protein